MSFEPSWDEPGFRGEAARRRLCRALWRFWDAALGRLPGRPTHPNWRMPFWHRHLTNALKISSGNCAPLLFDPLVQDMRDYSDRQHGRKR